MSALAVAAGVLFALYLGSLKKNPGDGLRSDARRLVTTFLSALLVTACCCVVTVAWAHLALSGSTAASQGVLLSVLYALPGGAIVASAFFPTPRILSAGTVRPVSSRARLLYRCLAVAVGCLEVVLCAFALHGDQALWAMIALFAALAICDWAVSRCC